jgi:serine/threonine-protein kinase HipA
VTTSLAVLLGDARAGTLERLPGGRLRFAYDDAYREQRGATPLSLSMPLQVREHPDRVVSPWLWGLLPDNERVLGRWAREHHVSASSPFALLATPIGHDCAGAVRFVDPEAVEDALQRPGDVRWLTEEQVAQRLRELREDGTSWHGRRVPGQFSLAGAQAKTALLLRDGRWGVPSGAEATSHILKPAVTGLDDRDLNEHLCLDAARRAGLTAAKTRVVRFGEESAIVVTRYDRRAVDGRLVRVHQEDVAQALGVHPADKYQRDGGPSAKDVVELMRRAMPRTVAEDSAWRFVDALAWNWLVAGTDAHAKNYSLLLAGDTVRLAPLYDVASYLPYDTSAGRDVKLAMKLGGDYRLRPFHDPWPKVAAELGLDRASVLERVRDLGRRAPDAFADAAQAPDVVALDRRLPYRLTDLVAERVRQCEALAGATGPSPGGRTPSR